ncbi:GRPE protein [Reticulomyxa filosa]|uniref:GrpE protein homolog n=1 Tax=Reticulomyxa filosa TaxID=46433 RepID=X6LWZ8_RETFI|nr:GRPE protein [Reticulomyxa filosa]|eukprot:ETO06448.1 GRPE protein [Reticulomyxa filosa]
MTQRDVENAQKLAIRKFSSDLLAVSDALQGAQRIFQKQKIDVKTVPEVQPLLVGLEETEKTLLEAFGKHGIQKIDCQGADFNPNLHQALFNVTTTEHPEGTIVQVLSEGYTLYNFVLRPARVGVAVAPPSHKPSS